MLLSDDEVKEAVKLITEKFKKLPNTGHWEIWLQRATLKHDNDHKFEELLCRKLNGSPESIWNSDWLNDELKELIDNYSVVDNAVAQNLDEVVSEEEVKLFNVKSNYV